MASTKQMASIHPFVVFWLGLLTGAIVVGLVFFYKALTPSHYQDSFYKLYWGTGTSSYSLPTMDAWGDPKGGKTGSGTISWGDSKGG